MFFFSFLLYFFPTFWTVLFYFLFSVPPKIRLVCPKLGVGGGHAQPLIITIPERAKACSSREAVPTYEPVKKRKRRSRAGRGGLVSPPYPLHHTFSNPKKEQTTADDCVYYLFPGCQKKYNASTLFQSPQSTVISTICSVQGPVKQELQPDGTADVAGMGTWLAELSAMGGWNAAAAADVGDPYTLHGTSLCFSVQR